MGPLGEELSHFGPQVIFGVDMLGMCTLSVGPGLKALGLRPGELVGQNLFDVYRSPEDVEALERALAGESFTTQREVNGRLLWTFFQPLKDVSGSPSGAVGVATDVTAHVQAQEGMLKFKALADDSEDLIAIADEDGRPVYLNPRVSSMQMPISPENLWSTVDELAGAAMGAEMRASVQGGGRWTGEVVLRLPQGETVLHVQAFPLFDADGGGRLGSAWIGQDVTDLRASETALGAANADLMQFRALVEASGDFIAITGRDGAVRYLNPAGRHLVGLSQDLDVTTTTMRDFLTPEGIERLEHTERPAVVEQGHWQGESTLKRVDGSAIPVAISSFLMHDQASDDPWAIATVQRDITERLAALRAREEFVALVAHELRTPLSSVKGYVELASESIEDQAVPAEVSDHLRVATRNIARMERMVEQILRISGERTPQADLRRPADIVRVVEEAIESARPKVESAGLEFVLETGPPMTVLLDESFVEVVDNLVSNATKYTPSGGRVEVTLTRDGGLAVLSVTDTGPGIAPSERDTIFTKFARGESTHHHSVPGLGLGLFITAEIVNSHDGEIVLDERPGRGARFVVRLPICLGDEASPSPSSSPSPA